MNTTNKKSHFTSNSRGPLGGTEIYLTNIGGTIPVANIKEPKEAKAVADSLNGLIKQGIMFPHETCQPPTT